MDNRFLRFLFLFVVFFLLSGIVFAEDTVRNKLTVTNGKEKDICTAVKKTVREELNTKKEEQNTKDVVKTGIQLGYSACLIVKCAIAADGKLKDIITGAIEAGASPDVISRCAIDAGAEARDVSRYILEAGFPDLCFLEPENLEPVRIDLPGDETTGRGFVSPSAP
jgi:hypothetical protein